jgi:Tripartite tricarboxylate transporter family receptor
MLAITRGCGKGRCVPNGRRKSAPHSVTFPPVAGRSRTRAIFRRGHQPSAFRLPPSAFRLPPSAKEEARLCLQPIARSSHAELFKMMAGVDLVHVPYSGSFVPDLLSGQVQCAFPPILLAIANIRAAKLRALAVTSATRSDALPDVPAVGEFVPGFEASIWHGIGAPRKTPAAIVDKVNREINAVLADPKIKERFADIGGIPLRGSPAALHALITDEIAKWGKEIQVANINPA